MQKTTYNAEDLILTPGVGRLPGEGNGNPLQYSCLGNPMHRGLAGYSPWGHKSRTCSDKTTTTTNPTFKMKKQRFKMVE